MKQNYLYEFVIDYPVVKNNRIETIIKAGTQFSGFDHFTLTTGLSDFKFRRAIKLGFVRVVTTKANTIATATTNNENNNIFKYII